MKKDNLSTIILILVFFVGLSLLLYPTISDYWNSFHSSRVVYNYSEQVANIDNDRYKEYLDAARDYNLTLPLKQNPYLMNEEELAVYSSLLLVGDSGVLGYVEIPSIDCSLPVYHGVSEAVLQKAIGHIEWTSLPVGGPSTHTVLSGHRGLPSAKLFTDLDKLVVGDLFLLRVLDETLTYEVDQILIVEPQDAEELTIVEGKDYCTLVTCTPYGINTHRLLVRGHRVENQKEIKTIRVTADAVLLDPVVTAPLVAAPMLVMLLVLLLVTTRRRK